MFRISLRRFAQDGSSGNGFGMLLFKFPASLGRVRVLARAFGGLFLARQITTRLFHDERSGELVVESLLP